MKCPYCGKVEILPNYKYCPSCKQPVSNNTFEELQEKAFSNNYQNKSSILEQSTTYDVEVVKNKVVWNLNIGEIARRINVDEFAHLSGVRGVYIQDGVKAVLIIDGDKVLEFESGLYYISGPIANSMSLTKRALDFLRGRHQNESDKDYDLRRNKMDIAYQALKENSVVEIILIADGYIPVVLNVGIQDGTRVFMPYKIPSKISTLDIGISMHMQIKDYRTFQINYLGRNRTFRIAELQDLIKDLVANELKRIFADTNIQNYVIPAEMEDAIRSTLKNRINMNLYGIEVTQVVNVTMNNEDFERFKQIEHSLYCTQNELEYLIRTNTFQNRLQDEKNAQLVREAKSIEELHYALQQVNKDGLLHEDELDAFVDLLNSQKRLRKAKTQEEEHEALLSISKNKLVANDDYEKIANDIEHHKLNRDEVNNILRINSYRRVYSEKIEAKKLLVIQYIQSEQKKEEAQYDATIQKQSHEHEIESRNWAQDDKQQIHNIGQKEREDDYTLGHIEKIETYEHETRVRSHKQDVAEQRDEIDTANYATQTHIKNVKDYQDISMSSMERMTNLNIKKAQAQAQIELDKARQGIEHEEEMERIKATILEAQKGLTAEQLAAMQLDKMSEEAQKAFALALSSNKELEVRQLASQEKIELYQKMIKMSEDYARANVNDQKDMMVQMIGMMQEALKTNADMAKSAVTGHNANINAQFDAIRDIATNRNNELKNMSDEYREEAHRREDYARQTSDSALKYTSETNKGKTAAEAMSAFAGKNNAVLFTVPVLGNDAFSFETMTALIATGAVRPDTIIVFRGQDLKAKDCPELRNCIIDKYNKKCPNCGKDNCLEGECCPECGQDL